ncbi:MAG: protein kinase, partial [Anaerolineales bacterium]
YLKGPTLATYLRDLFRRNERLRPVQVARLLVTLAAALDYAHELGVIHRDIKPGNIILHNKARELSTQDPLTARTEPVITDFGLVRIAHSSTQTASGVVSGTPAYMSPEQAQGVKVDHRSDIYSLGIVLYELIAGRVPFEADTSWTVILKHINDPPPPIDGIQPPVQQVIERVLAKDPDLRHQTCRELAADYLNAIGLVSESETLRMPLSSERSNSGRFDQAQDEVVAASEKRSPPTVPALKRILPIAGASLLLVALAAIGFSMFRRSISPTDIPLTTQVSTSEANVVPPIDNPEPVGLLRFQDGTASADQVTISTASMALPTQGSQYEAWLIEDEGEQRISIGIISFDPENSGSLTFVNGDGQNLIGKYNALEITVEPNPDNNPSPSNEVAFSVTLPRNGYTHVRHLLFSYGPTPNQVGLIQGLDANTELINQSAEGMLIAFEAGDEAGVRLRAEEMLNAIIGNQSDDHKDWNNDGTINDLSDGFGLLLNGENEGYIQGTFSHAGFAAAAGDATENMQVHGRHVQIATENIDVWTPQLRDQLTTILGSAFNADMEAPIRQAVSWANQIRNGIDVNGNENIEPIPGEGGARTAYEHAYYMADMSILGVTDQPPAP